MDPFTIFVTVVSIISGVASYQQAKKIQREVDRESRGVEANIESNIKAIPVVYGERRVGGTRVYIDTSKDIGNKYLYMVMAMAEGEIEDIHSIEIDDIPITDEKFILSGLGANFTYEIFYGSDTQDASELIIDGVAYSNSADVPPEVAIYLSGQEGDKPWNQNHKLNGVAYLAMRFLWDSNAYNGVPNVTAIVKGKKVYDPRNPTAPKAWSNNPALCIRDYLTSSRYGKGIPESAINDTMFSQAASDYDAFVVTPYDGGDDITLFELNTVIDTEVKIINNLNDMLMSCRGFLPYVDGKYGIRVDKATNHVMDVSSDHIIGGISIAGTKKEDRFNQVKVNFFNKDKEYKEDTAVFPDVDDPSDVNNLYQQYLAEDGGEPLVDDIKIDGISNYYTAREMAKLFLLRSRLGTAIAFRGTSELMELEVGDTFLITQPTPAWTNKKFQVQEIGLNFDGTVNIQAIEYSDEIYTYNTASEETPFVPTKLPNPNKLAPVTLPTASAGSFIDTDGRTVPFIDISWTAPDDALVDRYEIKYTINDEAVIYSAIAVDTAHRIVEAKGSYDIEIYAVNGFGSKSTGVTLSDVVAVADTSAPSNITSISIASALQSISLRWTNPSDNDFDLVRIKVADTNSEPTTHSFEVRSDSFVHDIGAYSTTKHYWLAPVDRTGNVGSYVSGGSDTTGSIAISDVPAVAGTFYLTLGDNNAPTNAEFNTAVGRNPIEGDVAVVNKAYFFTRGASAWTAVTEFIDGSLLVSDSVTATSLSTISADLGAITAGSIDINSGALTIDEDGNLVGTSVTVSGDITANTLTLTGAQVQDSRSSTSLILSSSQLDQSVINLIDTRIEDYGLASSGDFAEDTGGFNNTIPDHPVLENFTHLNGKNVVIELTASSTWSGIGSPTYPPQYPNNDSSLVIEIQRRVSSETDWTNAVVVDTITNGTSLNTVITGGTWVYGYSSVWFNGLTINYTFNDDPATGTYDYRAFIKTIGTNYTGVSTFYFEANEAGTASGGGVNDYVDSFSINDSTGVITVGRTGALGDLTANISTYVGNQVGALVDSAPATLDTLNELAAALGDDKNFAQTTATALGTKMPKTGGTFTGDVTLNNHVKLPQNPVGTTYGNTISAIPTSMITQGAGDNDGWRLYGEAGVTNDVKMIFEIIDDIEAGDTWVFRNKKTYGDYQATEPFKIQGNGNIVALGTITASGYNKTNWDTAYGWGNHASAGYLTSLPEATATARGGIELFSNTDQTVAANAVSSTASRTYGIQLNSAGQAVVNVPWSDTNTVYSHPSSHPATMITTTDEFTYSDSANVQDVLDDLDQAIANVNAKDPVLTLSGDVTGSATFTNLGNATLTATVANDSHTHDGRYYTETESDSRFINVTGDTMSGALVVNNTTRLSGSSVTFNNLASTGAYNLYSTRSSANAPPMDYGTMFTIGSNKASTTFATQIAHERFSNQMFMRGMNDGANGWSSWQRLFADNYHPNADKWTSPRVLTLTGDVSGTVTWDGSANVSMGVAVLDDSHSHANYITSNADDTTSGSISTAINKYFGYASTYRYTPYTTGGIGTRSELISAANFLIHADTDGSGVAEFVSIRAGAGTANELKLLSKTSAAGVNNQALTLNGNKVFNDAYHPNADKWTTARTITLSGDLSGSVSIDGSANVTLSAQVSNNSHSHNYIFSDVQSSAPSNALQYLNTQGNSNDSPTNDWYNTIRMGHGDPNTYYNNTLAVKMTGSGTGGLWGRTTTNGTKGTWRRFFADDYHPNADKWTTARTLSLTGDVTGSVSWDGSANASITTTVANDSHTHDTRYVQQGGTSFSGEYPMVVMVSDRNFYSDGNVKFRGSDSRLTVDGIVNTPTYQVNGTTVIDSSRNITVGAITASGKLYFNKDGQTNYHSVIDIDHVENNLWSFVFQSSTVGNDNESGFWVGNNGYPDLRIRRDDATIRALISSWETSYVSNNFNVAGGDLQIGGTTVINSARNATVNKVTATASGMSEFSTDLSSNDDYINSPISIRERNMAGGAASADMYAPNLNFHWEGRWSNSLWMNSSGHLVYGGYDTVGTPAANGVFVAGAVRTNTLTDLADTSTFLELEGDSLGMRLQTSNGFFRFGARNGTWCHMETDRSGFYFYKKINVVGTTNSTAGYELNGTTVIDSSRNLTNIGSISSGNITGADANFNHIGVRNTSNSSGDGISLYNGATGGQPTYGLMFAGTATYGQHGGVTGDWATYFTMSDTNNRGWIFKRGTTNVASINGAGDATFTGSVSSSNAITATGNITANNGWVKSGGGGFYVSGTQIVNSSRDLLSIANITCSGTNNTLGDINIQENVSASGYTFMRFKAYSTGTTLGSIYRSYGSMVYSTSSDYRLKENIVDLTGASDKIMAIPVRRFNFIEHPDRIVDGFLAHEVAEVVPEAVLGEKDAVDANGKPEYQSIDQSKLVPLLTAGLQEALAKIETLEARLSALEN